MNHLLDWRGQIEPPHKVHQTSFGEEGDCLAACVASIHGCEMPPNFALHGHLWWSKFQEWMNEELGVWPVIIMAFDAVVGYFIGTGMGERGRRHSVVCYTDARYGVGVVWDPHPEAKCILESLEYGIIYQCVIK